MDEKVRNALRIDMIIDITTTGRKSGQPRRMEIWSHYFDDRLIVTGSPGRRDWYANLVEHPEFTYHLKDDLKADLPATATPVTEESERRAILSRLREVSPFRQEQGMDDLEAWVAGSPMVIVTLGG
jgi:deazaflavin-dependent oxidoreductase (nitroreductase family)